MNVGIQLNMAIQQEIAALQSCLEALPSGCQTDEIRTMLTSTIEDKKRNMVMGTPINAACVEACRHCVQRCRNRVVESEQCLQLATIAVNDAKKELASKQTELAQLEKELLAQSIEVEPKGRNPNSIEGLALALANVMKEMERGGVVPGGIIEEASGHMSLLMSGIKRIAAEDQKN